jgi:hypothetical protein
MREGLYTSIVRTALSYYYYARPHVGNVSTPFRKIADLPDAACAAIESPGGAHKSCWVGPKPKWHENPKATSEKGGN